jgi:radical SAM superfamily enzyme YgiQ (UPF0313 family)
MDIRRISFIEVGAPEYQMLSKYTVARIGTVLLSTMLRKLGYDVKAFIEDIARPDCSFIEDSDLVCISTLTATAPRAYDIAKKARAQGIPVVMGGTHPSFMPEEALLHSDFVIKGEGERALPKLIESLRKGSPSLKSIEGLSYRERDGLIVHNPPGAYLGESELDSLPWPDFSLVHGWKSNIIYPLSTSRGCPFECRFCSVIKMFGRKYRSKSLEKTMEELRYVNGISKATRFFVDDNFTANKARSKELFRAMIAEGLTGTWAAQVRADVAADPELLRLMADAGCHTLYIGFESINPKTLAEFNKKQGLEDIIKCVRAVKENGLHIHGMFVLGSDADDLDTIQKTVDFAINMGIDTAQFMALTPLPGTPLFAEMLEKGRLLHRDWSKYNLQHVVFRPALISPEALQFGTLKGMARFYSWKYILKNLLKLDLHYTVVGILARRGVFKVLKLVDDFRYNAQPAHQ